RLSSFGANVLGLASPSPEEVVAVLEKFYREIGSPVSLSEAGINAPDIRQLAEMAVLVAKMRGVTGLSEAEAEEVYRLAI
ncbi:MAG TPA: hypothetical protein PLL10_03465, partial [Elusimicrobiales bacterium]|nr:hypothetical protein [Elusimicrobiales bacterium]